MKAGSRRGALHDVLRAVAQAAQLVRTIQRHAPRPIEKPDRTPLTVADLAAQAVVACALERAFPGDPLVAEEDASALSCETGRQVAEQTLQFVRPLLPALTHTELVRLVNTGTGSTCRRFWTLDPVDGTEGFLRAGHYVVALALLENYRPTVAMLGCPTLDGAGLGERNHDRPAGLLLFARLGRAAWIRPMDGGEFHPVHVSDVRSLRNARMVRSFAESHIDLEATRKVIQAAGIERPPALMDSQAKHVAIAAGHADLLVRIPARADYREHIWDHAAGALAIEEAGGRITDLDGRPLDFRTGRRLERNHGVVVSNGYLHAAVLEALKAQRCAPDG